MAACLATATARRRGSWITHDPSADPLGRRGRHRQDDHALQARAVPEQVVTGPQGAGSGRLGLSADLGQFGQRIALGWVPSTGWAQAGTVSWTKVGRISPMAPRGSAGRTGGTPHGTPGPS